MKMIRKIWHKCKQIPVIGIPYEKYIGSKRRKRVFEKKSKIVREHGIDEIKKMEEALSKEVSIYFADSGTLLGAIRDHKIIDWDPDIDYGIVVDNDFDWDCLQRIIEKYGFKKSRQWIKNGKITEQTYEIEGLSIDVFAHFKKEDKVISYGYIQFPGKKYKDGYFDAYELVVPMIDKTRKELLGDIYITVPDNAEEYLSYLYDDNWRIPDPDWVIFSGRGFNLLNNEQGKVQEY